MIRNLAAKEMKRTKQNVFYNPVKMVVVFYLPDKRRRDLDNLFKTVSDALNKIVYHDDSQIRELHLYRDYDIINPRTEILVEMY